MQYLSGLRRIFCSDFFCIITQIPGKALSALFLAKGNESNEDAKQPTSDSQAQPY